MEKLLLEKFFLNTCTQPERLQAMEWMLDASNDDALKNWMREHWDLLSFYDSGEEPDIDKIWSKLQHSIRKEYAGSHTVSLPARSPRRYISIALSLAAAAVAIFFIVNYFFVPESGSNDLKYASELAPGKNMIEKKNEASSPELVLLEDGTRVRLMPNSTLYYRDHFLKEKREVYLKGEAFFEVTNKRGQPFYVYSESLVTKVLGTSFNVKAFASSKNTEVSVQSGKVLVYDKEFGEEKISNHGVIVTPNQKTIFSKARKEFKVTLVETPVPVVEPGTDTVAHTVTDSFDFNEVAIRDVIRMVRQHYGIEIVVEQESLHNCVFQGNVSDLNLYEKLAVICEAINAKYQIAGTKILINGPGCK